MTKPTISVLMPVYNTIQFLDEAVESILNQTLAEFEFLILDDGSSDGSQEKLRMWAKKDKRITLVQDEKNLGLVARLNQGLTLARADLIARMDADDISLPERLQKQYQFMKNNQNVAALGCDIRYISTKSILGKTVSYHQSPIFNRWKAVFFNPLAHPTVIYRKDDVLKAGGYNPKAQHCEDFDLWQRLLQHKMITNLPEVLLHYRIHPQSVSRKHAGLQRENKDKIIFRNIKNLNPNTTKKEIMQLIEIIDFPHRNWPFDDKAYSTLAKLASNFADKHQLTTTEEKALKNWITMYHPLKRLPYFLLNRLERLWYNKQDSR